MSAFYKILVVAFIFSSCHATTSLFQENTDDWNQIGDAIWTSMDGELTGRADDQAGYLVTRQHYTDFILELEFHPDATINSGVFLRCRTSTEIDPDNCYELNIWDAHPNQDNATGAVVRRAAPLTKVATIDRWNTYRLEVRGNHLQAWINDVPVADLRDDDLSGGHIALQARETGTVRFRRVRIRDLK